MRAAAWINLGYRLEETNQTKFKMELHRFVLWGLHDTGDAFTVIWMGPPKRLCPTSHRPDSIFAQMPFGCTDVTVTTVGRVSSKHGSLRHPELCFGRTGSLEVQLGLDAHLLKMGNRRSDHCTLYHPVFSSLSFLVSLNLNGLPCPLTSAIFGSSRR